MELCHESTSSVRISFVKSERPEGRIGDPWYSRHVLTFYSFHFVPQFPIWKTKKYRPDFRSEWNKQKLSLYCFKSAEKKKHCRMKWIQNPLAVEVKTKLRFLRREVSYLLACRLFLWLLFVLLFSPKVTKHTKYIVISTMMLLCVNWSLCHWMSVYMYMCDYVFEHTESVDGIIIQYQFT